MATMYRENLKVGFSRTPLGVKMVSLRHNDAWETEFNRKEVEEIVTDLQNLLSEEA